MLFAKKVSDNIRKHQVDNPASSKDGIEFETFKKIVTDTRVSKRDMFDILRDMEKNGFIIRNGKKIMVR